MVVRSLTGADLQVEAEDEEGEKLVTSLVLHHRLEATGGGYGSQLAMAAAWERQGSVIFQGRRLLVTQKWKLGVQKLLRRSRAAAMAASSIVTMTKPHRHSLRYSRYNSKSTQEARATQQGKLGGDGAEQTRATGRR